MADILLHHYDFSPFAEKVRVCLGIKGLAWRSVDQPATAPKPQLTALTGGYRRIPVMQIGADIYCDSAIIIRELERRFPQPTLFPSGGAGLGFALGLWSDRALFQTVVPIIFGGIGDQVPEAFVKDREALSGRSFDMVALREAVPHMSAQLRGHVALISEQLADGRPFLTGDRPGLADATAYFNLWFVRMSYPPAASLLAAPAVTAWMERIAGIGHGQRSETSREEAIAIARGAIADTPAGTELTTIGDEPRVGSQVTIAADDYGREPIRGVLVGASDLHLSIRRTDAEAGEVVVHFPRIGFAVR